MKMKILLSSVFIFAQGLMSFPSREEKLYSLLIFPFALRRRLKVVKKTSRKTVEALMVCLCLGWGGRRESRSAIKKKKKVGTLNINYRFQTKCSSLNKSSLHCRMLEKKNRLFFSCVGEFSCR